MTISFIIIGTAAFAAIIFRFASKKIAQTSPANSR
jgi:hypothetical protein